MNHDFEYVGFWPRVGATLVDGFLLLLVNLPIMGLAYLTRNAVILGFAEFVMGWIFPAAAVIAFWLWRQATPGKMGVDAIIVDAETGGPMSTGQAIGRYLAYIPSGLALGLGYLWVAFDPKKRGWHDFMAGTVVVRRRDEPGRG